LSMSPSVDGPGEPPPAQKYLISDRSEVVVTRIWRR
jgi:hypothetical protein